MRVALMIEGQEDVTWDDWVALADACERTGIEALFRSDHYLSVMGRHERGTLEAWGTINALAAHTTSLRLGTMVSPTSFRHPSVLGKLVTTADHVSNGRVELGMGAGWSEVEHRAYGFEFLPVKDRMDVLAEQLEIVHDGHWGDEPFSFHGRHYTIENLDARPKPVQRPHPPLIMGGDAKPRSARLAARFADEYNSSFITPEQLAERRNTIASACEKAGREPIPYSMMTLTVIGADEGEVRDRIRAVEAWTGSSPDPDVHLVGTTEQVIERLRQYEARGLSRVYLQHLPHRDIDMVELIGRELVPAVAS